MNEIISNIGDNIVYLNYKKKYFFCNFLEYKLIFFI